jgi:hypothetical protein
VDDLLVLEVLLDFSGVSLLGRKIPDKALLGIRPGGREEEKSKVSFFLEIFTIILFKICVLCVSCMNFLSLNFMALMKNTKYYSSPQKTITVEPLYKDTPEMRISPLIRTPSVVPAT